MEKVLERCAALDVHKRQVTACAHVPDRRGERSELRAEFQTMTPDRQASEGFGVLHGRTAVLRHFEDFSEAFENWRVVAEELIDAGAEVVGVTHGHGSGKASGAVVDAHYAIVFTVRANTIVRAREYATRAEALEAVGLQE